MAAPMRSVTDGVDDVDARDHNDIKEYIEDGTYRVNTLALEIQATEVIDSSRNADFVTLKIGGTTIINGDPDISNIVDLTISGTFTDGTLSISSGAITSGFYADFTVGDDSGNHVGLTITQNDVTNNPDAVSITNAGTGRGLFIDQNGSTGNSAAALYIDSDGNDGHSIYVQSNVTRTSNYAMVKILDDGASTADGGYSGALMVQTNNGSNTIPSVNIRRDAGAGYSLSIYQNVNATAQYIYSASTSNTTYGLYIQTGSGASPFRAWYDSNWYFSINGPDNNPSSILSRNYASTTTTGPVLKILQDHASDNQNVLSIQNDGTGYGLSIDQNGNSVALFIDNDGSGRAIHVDQGSDAHGLYIYSNGELEDNALVHFKMDNASSTAYVLQITNDGTGIGIYIDNNGTAAPCLKLDTSSNGAHIQFVGDPTVASPADGDLWYDGVGLELYDGTTTQHICQSDGTTGGSGSAGSGNQYVELDVNGTIYKVLHDGTV